MAGVSRVRETQGSFGWTETHSSGGATPSGGKTWERGRGGKTPNRDPQDHSSEEWEISHFVEHAKKLTCVGEVFRS